MLHRMKFLLFAVLTLTAIGLFWGCNRLDGKEDPNQPPVVAFVNVPLDSSIFSYAPVVRWTGHDPDGMIQAFQYHDDSTQAAVNAYVAGNGPLEAYIAALPATVWTTTFATSDTIYLRRSEADTITQHIFMVRAIDDKDAASPVKVRTYFRTNQPPFAPQVKWAADPDREDTVKGYQFEYVIPDTLFWGDTLTSTWPGISFLWKGDDPDGRDLNIIPLTFSYMLVNDNTGESFPHPVYDDSNHVIGYETGWSQWSAASQVTFTASHALRVNPNFVLDGHYHFYVKVRDDGLTESDSIASAAFTAITPSFQRQLLIVDWTVHPLTPLFGQIDDAIIKQFYLDNLPGAFQTAEAIRQVVYAETVPAPIVYDDDQVQWFDDKNLAAWNRIPYEYIRQFKWVWIISDNPDIVAPEMAKLNYRLKVMSDYLDVGGQLWISGRRILKGSFNLGTDCGGTLSADGTKAEQFLRNYFHLSTICPAFRYNPNQTANPPDFFSISTTNPFLPSLEIDTAKVHALQFNTTHPEFLPEIDYFGRTSGTTGFDYASTLYNYLSSSALDTLGYSATNIDCHVRPGTTASQVYLAPAEGHSRLLSVSRIHNVTKSTQLGVSIDADFIDVDREAPTGNLPGPWRIIASTPAWAGIWLDTDILEVDYRYIPIRATNDQPVANSYIRFQGMVTLDPVTNIYRFTAQARYRTSLFTVPLYFMRNEPATMVPEIGVEVPPIQRVIAYQILYFNGAGSTFDRGN